MVSSSAARSKIYDHSSGGIESAISTRSNYLWLSRIASSTTLLKGGHVTRRSCSSRCPDSTKHLPTYSWIVEFVTRIMYYQESSIIERTQLHSTNMSDTFKLNCWVVSDDPTHIFSVEIPVTKTIYALNVLIKEKIKPVFDDVDYLDIWKVSNLIPTVQHI
jgi:hypothetical protein